jgi:hypothetical protein
VSHGGLDVLDPGRGGVFLGFDIIVMEIRGAAYSCQSLRYRGVEGGVLRLTGYLLGETWL